MALAGMQLMLKLPFALVSEQPAPDCVTDTVALADFVGSVTDVAFTTPIPALVAVNIPLASTVPTDPVTVHVTPAEEPVTLAVNCCVPLGGSATLPGVTLTEIGTGGGGGGVPPPLPKVTVTARTWDMALG